MRLGEYNADIIVDGKELEEYEVVHESPTKVTCWIASEEGKNLSVRWKCHKQTRSTAVSGKLKIDGIRCGGHGIHPGRLGKRDTVVHSCVDSETTSRDFIFSRVRLTDDDSLLDMEVPKELGDIHLYLRHGKRVNCSPKPRSAFYALGGHDNFHEKSKKATVHCVGLGPERPARHKPITRRLVRNGEPQLDFVFKYRPLAILQANGIAPRPTPLDREESITEVDLVPQNEPKSHDIKPVELNDRIRSLENELKHLRELQASTSEDRKPTCVKKEESEPRKRPLFTPGEIIDLT